MRHWLLCILTMMAAGCATHAFAEANQNPGKQIDDHTWQGRVYIEQDIPRITINNKTIKMVLSEKADQNAKDTFKNPNNFKVKAHGFIKATVTGTLMKDKEGGDVIAVDIIKLEQSEAANNGKKPADGKKK